MSFPSNEADRFQVRLPDGLRDRIKDDAAANNRSMNSEIVARLIGGTGIGLRDRFAGQALTGTAMHLADYLADASFEDASTEAARLARSAYIMADAMLAARGDRS